MKIHVFDYYRNNLGKLIRIHPDKRPCDVNWNAADAACAEYSETGLYGVVPYPHVLVLDVDIKNNKQGDESWARLYTDLYGTGENRRVVIQNTMTPSGGYHIYISLEGYPEDVYKLINKHNPAYPGIDFITHGKAFAVAADQNLSEIPNLHRTAGEPNYVLLNILINPPPASIDCLLVSQDTLHADRATQSTKLYKNDVLDNLLDSQINKNSKFTNSSNDDFPYTKQQVAALLDYISSDDYEIWYRVAWALMGMPFAEEEQYCLFAEWSSKSNKFHENTCKSKWDSLKRDYNVDCHVPIKIWSLVYLAKQHSPDNIDKINEIMQVQAVGSLVGRFCEVQNVSGACYFDIITRVYYREGAAQAMLLPLIEYMSTVKKKKFKMLDLKATGMVNIAASAVFNPLQPSPLFHNRQGALFVNTYYPQDAPQPINIESRHTKQIDFVINHIRQIAKDEYTEIILSFFKKIAQDPGRKINWMPVLEGGYGTGKSKLLELMRYHVIGDRYCRTITTEQFRSQFNSWAANSLFVLIEELLMRGKGSLEAMNVIKTYITNPKICRDEKNEKVIEVDNFTSYFALTNHIDCLQHADPRRYFAICSPIRNHTDLDLQGFRNAEEYFNYFASLASENNPDGGIFRRYFLDSPISQSFSPDIAPPSDFAIFKDATRKTEEYTELMELIYYIAGTHINAEAC